MKEEGKTIAVIGSGFNHIYPEENISLVKEIIKNGGAIISEYPPNTEANLADFPIRNRIIAGISECTIVIEAKFRSGSSVTARHCSMQGKKVYCVPGRIGDKTGRGTNNLIKKGAHILTDVNEILIELGEEKIQENEKIKMQVRKENNVENKFQKKTEKKYLNLAKQTEELRVKSEKYKSFGFDVGAKAVRNTKEEYRISADNNRKKEKIKIKREYSQIYKLVSKTPMNIDEIARTLSINIAEVNMKLTMMEIEGLVEVLPGNIIKIKEN